RKSYFQIADDDTFLIINVNRNTPRKCLTHTIQVFSHFHRERPNSKLYLHTEANEPEHGLNLPAAVKEAGLRIGEDVIIVDKFDITKPKPEATLVAIYNAADCFFTTAVGEGWGLTHTEAMAVGVPVVAPDNTVFKEHLGANEERG